MQPERLLNFTTFDAPEHQPFLWPSGNGAVLLVHGFPGTPAELRPLAEQLHNGGWTVEGLLLPGFGPELPTLPERDQDEWVNAIVASLTNLQKQYNPVVLLGFSLGAALSIQAAAVAPPDAMVLLAPFWRVGGWWTSPVVSILRPLFSQFKPFRLLKPDFNQAEVRRGLANFMPGLNLDDREVQQAVLEFSIPTKIISAVQQVGKAAYRQAATLEEFPLLIVQGLQDEIVRPARTRKLLGRLRGPIHYHELVAAHDLLKKDQPGWSTMVSLTTFFLNDLLDDHGSAT